MDRWMVLGLGVAIAVASLPVLAWLFLAVVVADDGCARVWFLEGCLP